MRAPSLRTFSPDPLSRALAAHGLAADRREEARRLAAGLLARARSAEAAAAERERLSRQALQRGEEGWGLSLDDAARDARRTAAACRARLVAVEKELRRLARAEQACLADLLGEISRFVAGVEGR
ncbi:MAG: hypothetical protein HZB56_13585 [Deltaproteobacteria bacterium]|nr:hypothetical protein [Deltaproteobacteria bacterium]